MIFVTVGTQLPFDRLVDAVDRWAQARGRTDVVAQTGDTVWRPRVIRVVPFLTPGEFQKTFAQASVIVSHAGLGTIISALELGKPVVVLPRRAELEEHRNDHQLATARRFAARRSVSVAFDEREIADRLDGLEQIGAGERIGASASPALVEAIRGFITGRSPEPTGARRSSEKQRGASTAQAGDSLSIR
ncbi:MAG: glycosyltransferase [Phycisphaeraceae bacterium]